MKYDDIKEGRAYSALSTSGVLIFSDHIGIKKVLEWRH